MDTSSAAYLASLHRHTALPEVSKEHLRFEIDVPAGFAALCKGNPNNAKVLLLSSLRHFIVSNDLDLPLAYQHGHHHIPLDMTTGSGARADAKELLVALKGHLNCMHEFPQSAFLGMVVADAECHVPSSCPMVATFTSNLASLQFSFHAGLKELEQSASHVLQALLREEPSLSAHSIQWKQALDSLRASGEALDAEKLAVLDNAWSALFAEALDMGSSFYGNGGDSIQAIRLLAKMKEHGAVVDLGKLLAAKTMAHWQFGMGAVHQPKAAQREKEYPLSDMQRKIWNHAQSFQSIGAYHEQFLFEIDESPDVAFLESCLDAVWRSYDQIRVRIHGAADTWVQSVSDEPMEVVHAAFESIESALQHDVKSGFNNALLRVTFISIGEQRYLLWSHHHVLLDGWSVGVLIRSFLTRIASRDTTPRLQPNNQLDWIRTEEALPEEKTPSESVGFRPFRFPITSFDWHARFEETSFELTANREIEDQRMETWGITRQIFALGALMLTLRNFNDTDKRCINGISSGRNGLSGNIDEAVGLFIQNISVPIPEMGEVSVSTFLEQLQSSQQERLMQTSRSNGNSASNASDLLFVYENYPYEDIEIEGFRAKLIHVQEITGFPLTFCVFPKEEAYEIRLVYDARRIAPDFIDAFTQTFEKSYHLLIESNRLPGTTSQDSIAPSGWVLGVPNAKQFDSIRNLGGDVGIATNAWGDVFDERPFSTEDAASNYADGIRHWSRFAFSESAAVWRDTFTIPATDFQEVPCPDCSESGAILISKVSEFLRKRIWSNDVFQIAVAKDGIVYPWIATPRPSEDFKIQKRGLVEFKECYSDLFADSISIASNLLVALDQVPTHNTARFDLILAPAENKTISIRHRSCISAAFVQDLCSFLCHPNTPVEPQLSLVPNAPDPAPVSVLEQFARNVQAHPDAAAARDAEYSFTFSVLDEHVRKLAAGLMALPDFEASTFIGIQLPKSVNALVSMLAVLKSGKAFVPIDSEWPANRIQHVYEKAGIALTLNKPLIQSLLSATPPSAVEPSPPSPPQDPAYALFTSGSTGKPKGVVVSNGALGNYLAHCADTYFSAEQPGTVHVFTPLAFDFTLTEVLGGLLAGCEVIFHSEETSPYDSVKRSLEDEACRVLKLTPSHIQLADEKWFQEATAKTLVVGGEPLQPAHVDTCLAQTEHRLINEYGPTEAAVGCVTHRINRHETPLIGQPIAGVGVAVIDEHTKLVPRGVAGELCLMGKSLASGYLNDTGQTERAFTRLNEIPEEIAYRTGDLVRMQNDGKLLFLSRIDDQIKLNGYRIEVQEIRQVIERAFGIACHVCAIKFSGGKQLVGFVETGDADLNLRGALEAELPAYMIPQRFINVAQFPTSSNGKLDAQRLHSMVSDDATPAAGDFVLSRVTVDAWLDRPEQWRANLSCTHLLQEGWERVAKQLNYLREIEAILGKSWVLGSDVVRSFFPEANHIPNELTAPKPLRWCSSQGVCIAPEDWERALALLREHKLVMPTSVTPLMSELINAHLNLDGSEAVVPTIPSEAMRWVDERSVCIVSDWSECMGVPVLLQRQPEGSFQLYLCSLDALENAEMLDAWIGHLNGLGQAYLEDGRVFERFGNCIRHSAVEQKVAEFSGALKRIACEVIDDRIIAFAEGNEALGPSITGFLAHELPIWSQPDEVVMCGDLASAIRGFTRKQSFGDFEHFIRTSLPEFSYLNGSYSLIEQGGDSITALRIVGKLRSLGLQADLAALLNAPNLSQFVTDLTAKGMAPKVSVHQIELTPIQQWFRGAFQGNKHHFNQSILLEVLMPVSADELVNVLRKTLSQFSILSQVYQEGWRPGAPPVIDLFHCKNHAEITERCTSIQSSFDLDAGPVAGAAVFECSGQHFLFISIHHFYCDGYSWRIVLDELQAALAGTPGEHFGTEVFGKVHQRFIELGEEKRSESSDFYGATALHPFQSWPSFTFDESTYTEWTWDIPSTQTFTRGAGFGQTVNEKFLYLFLHAWQSLNLPPTAVFFETHGRSYDRVPELPEALGWFTQFYPMFSDRWPRKENLLESISTAFEQLPISGLTYMAQSNWQQPPFPVLLNFLGNFDENRGGIAVPSTIDQGPMSAGSNPALSMVELNAMISEGTLKWMLRTHPNFDAETFRLAFDAAFDGLRNQQTDYVSADIDSDDLDAIGDLLGKL